MFPQEFDAPRDLAACATGHDERQARRSRVRAQALDEAEAGGVVVHEDVDEGEVAALRRNDADGVIEIQRRDRADGDVLLAQHTLDELNALDRASFAPVLRSASAESTHPAQYSECFGNRSFYQDGWKLVSLHAPGAPYDDEEWELYDLTTDPTETVDLADLEPDKVKELSAAWEQAAWDNQVFPLDDGNGLLMLQRRPEEAALRQPVTLLAGTPSLERYRSAQLVTFRSFDVEIRLDHTAGAEGTHRRGQHRHAGR